MSRGIKGALGLKMPKPPKPPEMPAKDNAEVMAAEEEQRRRAALARGRTSTLVTGFGGDASKANVTQKTLLGM